MVSSAIIFVANSGNDPTEVAIPWRLLSDAGYAVDFATETGVVSTADQKLLQKSIFAKALGADQKAANTYAEMVESQSFQHPHPWNDDKFNIISYDVVVLPGGHDKPMIQYLESASLHSQLAKFFPLTARNSKSGKALGAICHGVLALAFAKQVNGDSVLKGVEACTLPKWMEMTAWVASQVWMMGNYYRTYGKEGRWCFKDVENAGAKYQCGPMSTKPFAHVDPTYHFVTARFPGDAELFTKELIEEHTRAKAFADEP